MILLGATFLPPLLGGSVRRVMTIDLLGFSSLLQTAHFVYRWFEPRELYLHFILLVLAPLVLTPFLIASFSHVLLAALSAWICYLASLVACTVAYRLSPIHPLYKYPGPLLCKVTKLYFTGVVFGGKQHKYYNQLHRRYGDIVRIGASCDYSKTELQVSRVFPHGPGPNELSFSSHDFIGPVYGPNGMPKSACEFRMVI